jgi:hypothetical protein
MNVDEAMKTAGSGILCFRGHAAVSVLSAEVERLRAGAETQNAAIKILNGMIHDLQTELAAAKAASVVPVQVVACDPDYERTATVVLWSNADAQRFADWLHARMKERGDQ